MTAGAASALAPAARAAGVLGHGFGIRYDLPVPLYLYLAAGALVVAFSFMLVALFVRDHDPAREYPWRAVGGGWSFARLLNGPVPRAVMGTIGVLFLAAIILTGFLGAKDATNNPAEYLLWIYFWAATVVVSGVVGNIYALANPFSATWDAVHWALRRRDGGGVLTYPARLGAWPAVGGYLAFAFFELASGEAAHPRSVAALAVAYTVYTMGGMLAFGRDTWLNGGEFFSVLFRLVGAMGIIEVRSEPRAVTLRPPAVGLTRLADEGWDMVAFVVLTLSSLAFDGVSATPAWAALYTAVIPSFDPLGALGPIAVKGLGLVGLTLLFLAVYLSFVALSRRFGGTRATVLTAASLFAYTLVPIALVYNAAHNYSYMVIQGQGIIPLLADPLHRGAHLLPTAGYRPSFVLADAAFVWVLQVVLIVLGHVVAVYLSHIRALSLFPNARAALRSQLPMLVLMIIYTTTSLVILAQPITEAR